MAERGSSDARNKLRVVASEVKSKGPVEQATDLPPDFEPGNSDVICERGTRSYNHIGNRRFRVVIDNNLDTYSKATSKLEKSTIVMSIVDSIRGCSSKGRFIRQNPRTKLWYEVGDKLAREKVGQAIRECLKQREAALNPTPQRAKKRRRSLVPPPEPSENETDARNGAEPSQEHRFSMTAPSEIRSQPHATLDRRSATAPPELAGTAAVASIDIDYDRTPHRGRVLPHHHRPTGTSGLDLTVTGVAESALAAAARAVAPSAASPRPPHPAPETAQPRSHSLPQGLFDNSWFQLLEPNPIQARDTHAAGLTAPSGYSSFVHTTHPARQDTHQRYPQSSIPEEPMQPFRPSYPSVPGESMNTSPVNELPTGYPRSLSLDSSVLHGLLRQRRLQDALMEPNPDLSFGAGDARYETKEQSPERGCSGEITALKTEQKNSQRD